MASPKAPIRVSACHSGAGKPSESAAFISLTRLGGQCIGEQVAQRRLKSLCSGVCTSFMDGASLPARQRPRPYVGMPCPRWAMTSRRTSLEPPPNRSSGALR